MEKQLRPVRILPDFTQMAAGSVLIECGRTQVLCTASVEDGAPPFLRGSGRGWLTAEYAMLPGSTPKRKPRDGVKKDGRGTEIQRLIGRSLRACMDFSRLGERTITVDCDVLQADGGTRTASITGGFVAVCLAVNRLIQQGALFDSPIVRQIAAVSVGIVEDELTLDLDYARDSRAAIARAKCCWKSAARAALAMTRCSIRTISTRRLPRPARMKRTRFLIARAL